MSAPRIERLDRNLLINGNYDYWQRGTSLTATSAYGADRWRGNSAIDTMVRRDRAFSAGLPAGSKYGCQVTSLAGGGAIQQRIESLRATTYAGQYVTMSFKAGLVSGSTQLRIAVRKPGAADNWATSTVVYNSSFFAAPSAHASGYTTYSYTFLVDQSMADVGFSVEVEGDATVWSIIVSQAALVLAQDAFTDYVPEMFPYAGRDEFNELQLCQRYYETGSLRFRAALTSGSIEGPVFFRVSKRTTPVVTEDGPTETVNNVHNEGFSVNSSSAAFTIAWTASAEL